MGGGLLPATHPWAWWAWALSAAGVVSLTTNPALLVLVDVAVLAVVLACRGDTPWAKALRLYLVFGLAIIVIRVVFQITVGSLRTGRVLFRLPGIPLPGWIMGIRLGGPVTVDGLCFALSDGLRLASLVFAVGAANILANPRRTLRVLPAAFHGVSTALIVAVTMVPQLAESVGRVRRAQRLRGAVGTRLGAVTSLVVPVMADAIERSLSLAASMEVRGYGRTTAELSPGGLAPNKTRRGGTGFSSEDARSSPPTAGPARPLGSADNDDRIAGAVSAASRTRYGGTGSDLGHSLTRTSATAGLGAVVLLVLGLFLLLGVPAARAGAWSWVCLGTGAGLGVVSLIAAGRRSRVTRYRPESWTPRDSALVALGLAALATTLWLGHGHAAVLSPSPVPARWPPVHPALVMIAVLLLGAAATGRPESTVPAATTSSDGPTTSADTTTGGSSSRRTRLRPETADGDGGAVREATLRRPRAGTTGDGERPMDRFVGATDRLVGATDRFDAATDRFIGATDQLIGATYRPAGAAR